MPAVAAVLYVKSRWEKEQYHMGLLWNIAVGAHREKPVYYDLPRWDEYKKPSRQRTDYGVRDVIDMFKGKGKLRGRGASG